MDYFRDLNEDMEFAPLIPTVVYERKPTLVLVPGDSLEGCAARQNMAYPMGAPPTTTPKKQQEGKQLKSVSPGSITPCKFRFVYIWLDNGREFWAWPTYIDKNTLAGFRWNGRRWLYFGIDLKRIDSFVCY